MRRAGEERGDLPWELLFRDKVVGRGGRGRAGGGGGERAGGEGQRGLRGLGFSSKMGCGPTEIWLNL